MQTALEVEVEEFLGRARYQRTAGIEDAREGSRNGFCPTTIKTTAGPVTLKRPKLRGTTEKFASRLFGAGVTRTNALESLVIAGYVRGLSDSASKLSYWLLSEPRPRRRRKTSRRVTPPGRWHKLGCVRLGSLHIVVRAERGKSATDDQFVGSQRRTLFG